MGLLAASAPLYDNAKLRTWRRDAGLSREQVWAGTGVGVSWLSELEQGAATPSLATLVALARFYGHEPAELLTVNAA
jgi:transcriptional regulator with XRE-family HTH domain